MLVYRQGFRIFRWPVEAAEAFIIGVTLTQVNQVLPQRVRKCSGWCLGHSEMSRAECECFNSCGVHLEALENVDII